MQEGKKKLIPSLREKKKKGALFSNFDPPKQQYNYTNAWLQSYAEVSIISEIKHNGTSECFESATNLISH